VDHKTLGYIRTINDTQLQILRRLQATEDRPALVASGEEDGDLSLAARWTTAGDISDLHERSP
jgi:hypothetical protein